ncbi:MAG: cbb3-type cytochrome c oxidase subunit I [Chloroflexi bacterium]|nr:cbb3-type cytochrome c oxidase subunit I [Chloroflexota bacterium]
MEIVPTTLVRISRYYMVAAIAYLLLTLAIGVYRVLVPVSNDLVHWAPAVLGWVSFPIMGAYYQFFPTLQGRDLRWDSLTIPQFVLMNLGVLGLMGAALAGNAASLSISAAIYTVGALLFAAIIILANVDFTKIGLTLRFYLASLAYFVVAILLFFAQTVGIAPSWADRPLMLHVLVFGWAIVAIMGAEYSMVPMLQLKKLRHPRLADAQFYFVNAGFWGLAASIAFGTSSLLVAAFGAIVLAAILTFAYIIAASLRHGPSRLPHMDISVKYFLVGIAYLVATSIVGIFIGAFGWRSAIPIHVHLGLIGAVTMTIVGAMYHVVPFVVWWEVYAPRLGYEDVPLLKQLFNERCALLQLYGLNAGLLLMIAGFTLRTNIPLALGGAILLVTALAFAWAMVKVVGHRRNLRKPIGRQTKEKTSEGTL